MSIEKLFDKTVDTQRMARAVGSYKESLTTILTDLPCAIQPIDQAEQLMSGAFFKGYNMWCATDIDIAVGDRIIDGTTTYIVKSVSDNNFGAALNKHTSLILELAK